MKKFYLAVLAALSVLAVRAQDECATDAYNAYRMSYDSSFKEMYLQQRQDARAASAVYRNADPNTTQSVIRIPTVVHILHMGEPVGSGSNIPDAQIFAAIQGLNDRFRGIIDSTPDIGIEFCLASRDPNGCPTNGITRTDASSVPLYANVGMSYTNCGANEWDVLSLARWREDQYFNIYVVWQICSGALGYSMGMAAVPGSGVVLTMSMMSYGSNTLTHECGHALWLDHTHMGDAGNMCPVDTNCLVDGDGICDTPPHRTNDCGAINPCSSTGVWGNSKNNYMSYCGNRIKFTPDQRTRMLAAANAYASLQASPGCTAPAFNPLTQTVSNMSCHNTCDGSVSISQAAACVPQPYTYLWSTGATTSSISGLCAGTYSVTVTNATNQTVSYTFTIVNPAPIAATASVIPGGCNASAVVNVTGGTPFPSSTLCGSASLSATIGTGTNAGNPSWYPAPYGNQNKGSRHAIMITAAELQAAGVVPGPISSYAMNVVSVQGASQLYGFTVKMCHTTQANLYTSPVMPMQTVINPRTVNLVAGWNTHLFDTPFIWDGVSNIVIESCFNNPANGAFNTQCYMSTTAYFSIAWILDNNGTACTSNPGTISTLYRPNVRLSQCMDSLVYHYQWSNGDTNAIATGLLPGTYSVVVTDGRGCSTTATCTVTSGDVPNPMSVTATVTPGTCSASAAAAVTGGSPSPSPTLCGSGSSTYTIGTGTHLVSPTNYPAVYGNRFWGARHQMLIRASELTASGVLPGKITALAFDVYTVLGTSTLVDFSVKMKHTSATTMTAFDSGLQLVMSPQTISITTGWNTHTFDTPFIWDGVSNILIEVCFNNTNDVVQNSQIYMTLMPYNSCMYNLVDNMNACNDLSNVWSTTARPNVRLTQCPDSLEYNYQWSNGQTVATATNLTTGTYTLTVTDGAGCIAHTTVNITSGSTINAGSDTTVLPSSPVLLGGNPTATGSAPFTYSWFPSTGLTSATIANPVCTVMITTTYVLTCTDASGCPYTDTVTVFVDPLLGTGVQLPEHFTVYPNPAQHEVRITGSNMVNGNYMVEVLDMLGQNVYRHSVTAGNAVLNETIDVQAWPSGIYILRVAGESSQSLFRIQVTH